MLQYSGEAQESKGFVCEILGKCWKLQRNFDEIVSGKKNLEK